MKREEKLPHKSRKSYHIRSALIAFIAGLPYKYIESMGRLLGMLMYFVDVPHRRIVRRNLQFIYPEWTLDHIKETSARIFQNIGTGIPTVPLIR